MSTLAQVMMKQKNNRNLDARQSMLVESAYYQCNPPQHFANNRKKTASCPRLDAASGLCAVGQR